MRFSLTASWSTVSAVFTLDQVTKFWADTSISPVERINVLPVFELVNIRNKGAAFGMLGGMGNTFFVILASLAIAAIGYMIYKELEDRLALALILGGAIGNLADRLIYGEVRDFLYFHLGRHYWPAFNVADSALTIGLILILIKAIMPMIKGQSASHSVQ